MDNTKENGLNNVVPPPPEYILIICIIEFLVSNCKMIFLKAWSIPIKELYFQIGTIKE
jgi:hypothetical protein